MLKFDKTITNVNAKIHPVTLLAHSYFCSRYIAVAAQTAKIHHKAHVLSALIKVFIFFLLLIIKDFSIILNTVLNIRSEI